MSQFFRECFSFPLLQDEDLQGVLHKLCVPAEEARPGDVLALEYPYRFSYDEIGRDQPPTGVLVAAKGGLTQLVPWYSLAAEGLDADRMRLIGVAFNHQTFSWEDLLSHQLRRMVSRTDKLEVRYDLYLGPGCACVLIDDDDEAGHVPARTLCTDEELQKAILCHGAVALGPTSSNHGKLMNQTIAERGNALLHRAGPIFDPRTNLPLVPAPRVP